MMALIIAPNISNEIIISALFTFFLATLLLLFLFLSKHIQIKEKQLLPLPPGPRGLPILGSLLFLNPNLHHYFSALSQSYGPILSLRLGSKLVVVISSPSAAQEIFKTQDNVFANHAVPAAAKKYLKGSSPNILFAPFGPLWRMLRKTAVREMLGTAGIEAVAPLRCREMRQILEEVGAKAVCGAAVNVREMAFRTMLNMMTSMLWGERVGCVGEGKEFRRAIEEVVDLLTSPNVSDFFPAVALVDPQGLGRRMRKHLAWINKYLDEIVERKKRMMETGERRRDVLESLLDCVDHGDDHTPFTMDNFNKLVVDLIGAATDSTSTTIEWSIAELLKDPTKMQKAQQELDAVVGKNRVVEGSDISQLHYTRAIVKESLRLHAPLPLLIPHCPSANSAVAGFSIPAGTTVLVNVWAIHRNPSWWGKDAEEFKPERFMDITGNERNEMLCYMPFGAGRRACAGMAMGERMVYYVLASLLHSFDWSLPLAASLEFGEKFGTVLRKAEQLVAVPAVRLAKPELYS